MKYKVVLVPFPFDNLSGSKVRPAVCLTARITGYSQVVIAFITSQLHNATEDSDLIIRSDDEFFKMTGLKVSSAIRLHRLVTVPDSIILRQLGTLSEKHQKLVESGLRSLFGL